jgi:hypothetical protein
MGKARDVKDKMNGRLDGVGKRTKPVMASAGASYV